MVIGLCIFVCVCLVGALGLSISGSRAVILESSQSTRRVSLSSDLCKVFAPDCEVSVVDGADIGSGSGLDLGKVDFLIDNWSDDGASASAAMELAKKHKVSQYIAMTPAENLYQDTNILPIQETFATKAKGECRERDVEMIIESQTEIPYTIIRTQNVYGNDVKKHNLDYFINRAHRDLHVPLPLHGEQLLSLVHAEDVAGLVKCALGNPDAVGEVFNCASKKYLTYKSFSDMVYSQLGKQGSEGKQKHLYFEPKLFDLDSGGTSKFPFSRDATPFSASKATSILGWTPKHNIVDDLASEIEAALARSAPQGANWGMKELRSDMEILASKDSTFLFEYPFFYETEDR
jgi:hypothetical protein